MNRIIVVFKRKEYKMIQYVNMTIKEQKNIALIAHDGKKQEMLKWCEKNKSILRQILLYILF